MRGDPKITRIIFLKWFIRFYTITTLVSFKVLTFQLDTLVPMFFPLLKTYLKLSNADAVQDRQRFVFHFADINKTFPFHLAFNTREQEKVYICRWLGCSGWVGTGSSSNLTRTTNSHLKRIISTSCCIHTVYLLMMDLDTPETYTGWQNKLRISCASSWFFFTRLPVHICERCQ